MQTPDQRREHFAIERELRERLMNEPDKARRRQLYGEVYAERTRRTAHHPLVEESRDPAARATATEPGVRLVRGFLKPKDFFLEIGAWDGALAKAVAPFVSRSVAVDVHAEMALPSDGNFDFVVFDGFALALPSHSVDVAYSNDVVEHLHEDDLLDQTREVHRVLKPGGKYICVTPNRLTGPHDVSRDFSRTPQGFHLREYTDSELARVLVNAGFRRVQLFLSYHGWRLSPLLPVSMVSPLEAVFERMTFERRQRLGGALAAIKVVASA